MAALTNSRRKKGVYYTQKYQKVQVWGTNHQCDSSYWNHFSYGYS